ncbi:putative SOUL hem-binding protein [Lupinus albus]|uniref:Putative SOUL hem-binding protein n=1 Tax=Lupinus albus TaxID=3870 RepID=A0A6A4PNJ4_LUPAL|nr:putative SOUL hem-binding protein [Lupinus albus]
MSLYVALKNATNSSYPNRLLLRSLKSQLTLSRYQSVMGMVLGKISVETPKYEVIKSTNEYEIRKYPPSVLAEVTYEPSEFKGNKDGGFMVLANYIGALGNPQNTKPEKIAMTAPVITKDSGEKIAMTAPVVTKADNSEDNDNNKTVTMQFILPSVYGKAEEAPKPTDERVVIRDEGERKYGVVKFGGVANEQVVKEKVEKLKKSLEIDGFKVIGDFLLARYNPPWTIPLFRTNEEPKTF